MALKVIKSASPWWVTALFIAGIAMLFIGQRALAHLSGVSMIATIAAAALAIGATALRGWAWTKSSGAAKRIEKLGLIMQVVGLLGMLVYLLTSKFGVDMLGITEPASIAKFAGVGTVLWATLFAVSIISLLMLDGALGMLGRDNFEFGTPTQETEVEAFKAREALSSGLTISLGLAFLMVTCNIANERDVSTEVTYFRTTEPGSATINVAKSMDKLEVLAFFPEVSQVGDEVAGYFRNLSSQTGNVEFRRLDRLMTPGLAKKHKVNRDGSIVFINGEQSEKITITTQWRDARKKDLREFDEKVQKGLMKVVRAKRTAYLSVGHGEMNDPDSAGPLGGKSELGKATLIKQLFGMLNYEVKNFSGLGKPVPDDATMLVILAPSRALIDVELQAIDDYLGRGGSLLFALDPQGEAKLGMLESRLGVSFDPTSLADDKEFMVRRRNPSDHRQILTNQFSAHASVTTLSRGRARAGIVLINSGSLDDAPFAETDKKKQPKRTYVVRTLTSTFRDTNGNFTFDKDTEKRKRYNIAAAIEDDMTKSAPDAPKGMRAMVLADGELFSDTLIRQVPLVQALVADSVKWLGGEEKFQGDTKSTKPKKMELTKGQDTMWFYITIIGAPILILLFGLGIVAMGRRRSSRRKS